MATLTLASTGTLGDHFPFFALGAALVQRGHLVRYAGPTFLREHVEECGMQFFRARPDISPELVRSRPEAFNHWREDLGGTAKGTRAWEGSHLFEKMEFEACLHDILQATRGSDLLICSRLLAAGRTVSDLCGTPWVTACVLPWLHPTAGTPAAVGIAERRAKERTAPMTREFRDRIHQLRRAMGLEPMDLEEEDALFESDRVLLATSSHFGVPAPQSDQQLVQTGFWLHRPPQWAAMKPDTALLRHWEEGHRPLVLAFSSQPMQDARRFLDIHLQAARLLNMSVLVQSGWARLDSPLLKEMQREGDAFMLPEGPQEEAFSHASVVITHGGIGTIARALTCGAPLLVEPHGNDQFYNARQVLALGAGAAMNPHRLEAEGVVHVLENKVMQPICRAIARQIGAELSAQDGIRAACEAIEGWTQDSSTT